MTDRYTEEAQVLLCAKHRACSDVRHAISCPSSHVGLVTRVAARLRELEEALDTLLREERRDDDDPVLQRARSLARAALARKEEQGG